MFDYYREKASTTNIKAYQKVLENESLFRRNYHMMQLYTPSMAIDAKKLIRDTFREPDLTFNKTELIKMMMKDGFGEINFIDLYLSITNAHA